MENTTYSFKEVEEAIRAHFTDEMVIHNHLYWIGAMSRLSGNCTIPRRPEVLIIEGSGITRKNVIDGLRHNDVADEDIIPVFQWFTKPCCGTCGSKDMYHDNGWWTPTHDGYQCRKCRNITWVKHIGELRMRC
jgi:hypothetical protein